MWYLSNKFSVLCLFVLLVAQSAQADWDVQQLGLSGGLYTRSDGYQRTALTAPINESGQVLGNSSRYSNTGKYLGNTAWAYSGSSIVPIGLTGPGYTGVDGSQTTLAEFFNNQGMASGTSLMKTATTSWAAWYFDGASTKRIGFYGSDYTKTTGTQYSEVSAMNDMGLAVGYSERYNGRRWEGREGWLYNGSQTLQLGLTGSEFIRSDGRRFTDSYRLNQMGYVAGNSERFLSGGTLDAGSAAWLYDGVNTTRIGLVGSAYTGPGGDQYSYVEFLSENGHVGGNSRLWNGTNVHSRATWVYDGSQTVRIGLYGAEFTATDGAQKSTLYALNDSGQAAGLSEIYDLSPNGFAAWFYDGSQTKRIGLTGTGYTRDDGLQRAAVNQLNNQGQVTGTNVRYTDDGTMVLGQSAWFYDGNTTRQIGLMGGVFTRKNGYHETDIVDMNDAGQVIGYSTRVAGASGRSAFFYDYDTDQTFDLTLSTRSDGYVNTVIYDIGENGDVFGTYRLFDENDQDLGDRGFYFSPGTGLYDLADWLLAGGLDISTLNFESIVMRSVNSSGQMAGYAVLNDGVKSVTGVILTPKAPPVPIPATLWMFLSGILLLCERKRQRS